MGIDQSSRDRLQQMRMTKDLVSGLQGAIKQNQPQVVQSDTSSVPLLANIIQQIQDLNNKLDNKLPEAITALPEILKTGDPLSPEQIAQFSTLKKLLQKMEVGLEKLDALKLEAYRVPNVNFPENLQVHGKVNVETITSLPPVEVKNFPVYPKTPPFPTQMGITDLPPVTVSNLRELGGYFNDLNNAFLTLASKLKITSPDSVSIKDSVEIKDWDNLLGHIDQVNKGLNILINQEKGGMAKQVEVTNFPVPKIPNPVTHFSLNSLNGFAKSTAVTVTSALTPLPGEVLSSRRSIVIYNNGSQTVEIGGSTFVFGQGVPITAGTWGPALDAGSKLIIYGRVASGSCDLRVLELSDISTGV